MRRLLITILTVAFLSTPALAQQGSSQSSTDAATAYPTPMLDQALVLLRKTVMACEATIVRGPNSTPQAENPACVAASQMEIEYWEAVAKTQLTLLTQHLRSVTAQVQATATADETARAEAQTLYLAKELARVVAKQALTAQSEGPSDAERRADELEARLSALRSIEADLRDRLRSVCNTAGHDHSGLPGCADDQ